MDAIAVLLAQGRVGIVDAAMVRWLTEQRTQANRLLVHVTDSAFEPLLSRQSIEQFLAALEPVDEVVHDNDVTASQAEPSQRLEA